MIPSQLGGGPGGPADFGGGPGGAPGGPDGGPEGGPVGGPDGGPVGGAVGGPVGGPVGGADGGAVGGPVGGADGGAENALAGGADGGVDGGECVGSVVGTIEGLDGGTEAGMACCDSNKPPAKAACIGSSELTSIARAVSSSISPKPSIAAPKAAAKGSPALDSTEEWICGLERFDFSGLGLASIRRSLVNGPNSKLPDPASVL